MWSSGSDLLLDGKDLLEDEALCRNVGILVHRVSRFDAGDFAVYAIKSRAFRADGKQVVFIVEDTDAKDADPVGGTEHLHVDGLAAVRASDGFRLPEESDGV